MTTSADDLRRSLLAAFRMPSVQTMVSRKSSITNAFVNAIIPVIPPSHDEIEEALRILGMEPNDVRCAIAETHPLNGIIYVRWCWDDGQRVMYQRLRIWFRHAENAIRAKGTSSGEIGSSVRRNFLRPGAG